MGFGDRIQAENFGTIRTCQFIDASDLFQGSMLAWNVFVNGEPDCSWGNNNRTMVCSQTIIDVLENSEESAADEEIAHVIDKCKAIIEFSKENNEQVYIDLEN